MLQNTRSAMAEQRTGMFLPWRIVRQVLRFCLRFALQSRVATHGLLSGSFLGLPYRILNMNPKKELLRSLWLRV